MRRAEATPLPKNPGKPDGWTPTSEADHDSEAYLAVIEPTKETGMQDYRLDELDNPQRHQAAAERLSGRHPRARVNLAAGELPGRKVDGRR